MSPTPTRVTRTVTIEPSRDGRLVPYGIVTFASLGAALYMGSFLVMTGLMIGVFAALFAIAMLIRGSRRRDADSGEALGAGS